MAFTLWSQDVFSRGELSPLMYARATVNAYFNGLKIAKNTITLPQGAVVKRFGTTFVNEITGVTNQNQIFFKTFQYLNECVYLVVFKPGEIDIFLEGFLVATVVTTFDARDIQNMDHTVLDIRFRVTTGVNKPKDLTRSANTPVTLTAFTSDTFSIAGPLTNPIIYPIRFFTTGTLPVTSPQIKLGITYFLRATSTTDFKVYTTASDAFLDVNAYVISSLGTGTNTIRILNTWSFSDVVFQNLPVFDFTGGYNSITFTPSATTGAAITITASSAIFTVGHVGGAYAGGGGIARITGFTSSTSVTAAVAQPFDSTSPISGALSLLAEPAWSDARGWPRLCSSFQNRSFFANTDSLPNGVWASSVNDYEDFNDIEADDDNAISYYPTSDDINYIRFIVPYRSLTIHTNSGVYSTPLSVETAITPRNFSLLLQDSTPAEAVQPTGIDNQIIIISGNDVHSMLWDGFNNAYNSNIVSVANEHLIRNPIDQAAFTLLSRTGSRYVFIVNGDGSLAIYQTLIAEQVSGFSPAYLEQPYGEAYFRRVASNFDGRSWFVTERQIGVAASPVAITAVSSEEVTAVSSNFSTTDVTQCTFTTSGTLPISTPQIAINTYYWVIGIDADTFKVYRTKTDAETDTNAIVFSSAGSLSNVVAWPLSTKFYIEEVDFDVYVDCASLYEGTPVSSITNLSRFNGQLLQMNGDGFGFENTVVNDTFEIEAHGESREVSEAQVGFPIEVEIVPMQLSIALGSNVKTTNLLDPKHIRSVSFMFNNTVGGTVDGFPIAMRSFDEAEIGSPPEPTNGIYKMSLMKGWQEFQQPEFTISHREPFDFRLIGIFYKVEA